jgi:hypothetical protein
LILIENVPKNNLVNKALKKISVATVNKGMFNLQQGQMKCPVTVELPKSVYLAGEQFQCKVTCDNSAMDKPIGNLEVSVNMRCGLNEG